LGATRYIGVEKWPTLSIYQLIGNDYQVRPFRGRDKVASLTFPELALTAEQIFQAGQVA